MPDNCNCSELYYQLKFNIQTLLLVGYQMQNRYNHESHSKNISSLGNNVEIPIFKVVFEFY
jgi:hypothetical protein